MTISNQDHGRGAHVLNAREANVVRPSVFGSMPINADNSPALGKERNESERVAELRKRVLTLVYGAPKPDNSTAAWRDTLNTLQAWLPGTNLPPERRSENPPH